MTQNSNSDLTHLAGILLSGSDTLNFLQGQSTQDIKRLALHEPIAAGFCNAKGRLISNVRLVLIREEPTEVLMIGEKSGMEALAAHLKKYAPLFRQMTFGYQPDQFQFAGFEGRPDADQLRVRDADDPTLSVMPWAGHRTLVCTHARQAVTGIKDQQPIPEQAWKYQDILEQMLWLDGDQAGEWIPQNVSLDDLDGVSFKKGCYTGQEVVARLHYKGKSKKRLFRLKIPATDATLNAPVYAADKVVGHIIQLARGEQDSVALAVLKVDKADQPLTVGDDPQVPVELLHSATP